MKRFLAVGGKLCSTDHNTARKVWKIVMQEIYHFRTMFIEMLTKFLHVIFSLSREEIYLKLFKNQLSIRWLYRKLTSLSALRNRRHYWFARDDLACSQLPSLHALWVVTMCRGTACHLSLKNARYCCCCYCQRHWSRDWQQFFFNRPLYSPRRAPLPQTDVQFPVWVLKVLSIFLYLFGLGWYWTIVLKEWYLFSLALR